MNGARRWVGFTDALPTAHVQRADAQQVAGMLGIGSRRWSMWVFGPGGTEKLMPRLNQLFNRAQLSPEEIHILRGIAKAMLHSTPAKH